MADEQRLSEAIDEECGKDGARALAAFKSVDELRKYPGVREAIKRDARLRRMTEDEVLEKIARPYAEEKLKGKGGAQDAVAERSSSARSSSPAPSSPPAAPSSPGQGGEGEGQGGAPQGAA